VYGPGPVTDEPAVCQNCARDDDDLVPVTRLYVVPETWDEPGSVTPATGVELWCFSCRTQYPHEDLEPPEVEGVEPEG
jgi:hypothetical protein